MCWLIAGVALLVVFLALFIVSTTSVWLFLSHFDKDPIEHID